MDKKSFKISWARPLFCGQEKQYLTTALESTWISDGEYVREFEKNFVKNIRCQHFITTCNGTAALHLALLALGLGPGDEVIVPGFTFAGPVNMTLAVGAIPIYTDIDPHTWCLDPSKAAENITQRTKAIIAVHTYGNVCEMQELTDLAEKHGIPIIEDAAEAAFSRYNGDFAGTLGNIGCFSFQAAKTLAMGEGGGVSCRDEALYKKMTLIRNHGMAEGEPYFHTQIGHNFRLTNLQAALGCAQLENIDRIIKKRDKIFNQYLNALGRLDGLTFQKITEKSQPVIWAMAVKIDKNYFKGDRDFIMQKLAESGIETRPGFHALSKMPLYNAPALPVSEITAENILCLPCHPGLNETDIEFICEKLIGLKK